MHRPGNNIARFARILLGSSLLCVALFAAAAAGETRTVAGEITTVTLHIPKETGNAFQLFVEDEFGVPVSRETSISLEWIPEGNSTVTVHPTAGPGNFAILPHFDTATSRSILCEVILPDGRTDLVAFGDVDTAAGTTELTTGDTSQARTPLRPIHGFFVVVALLAILYGLIRLFGWWASTRHIPVSPSTRRLLMVAVPLLILLPVLTAKLTPLATGSGANNMQTELRNSSAFATILGEFRLSASDMVFVKTERYMHNGVGFEPHLDMAELQSSGKGVTKTPAQLASAPPPGVKQDEHADHDHDHDDHDHDAHAEAEEKLDTVIPQENEDFRGWIGDLAREVKPFHRPGDPHYHTEGTELLPWYRIATLSDPSNTRMYTIGSWWLKSLGDPEQSREAVEFLNEGIRNNPNAFELHVMRAFILRDLDRMDEAHASFMRAAEIANTQYLADKGDPEKWDDTRIEQAYSAFNMAILMTRDGQGTQTAAQLARTYTRTFPSPNPMERILRSLQKQ